MAPDAAVRLARRYVTWLRRRARLVAITYVALLAVAIWLVAYRLPLFADFSYLLPEDAPSVRDLSRLHARVRAHDSVLAIVQAPSPDARRAAMQGVATAARALPSELVAEVVDDDLAVRQLVRAHLPLFVPIDELVRVRDALRAWLALGGPVDLDALSRRAREAEQQLARPGNVSADGTIGLVEIRIAFSGTDSDRAEELIRRLEDIRARVLAGHPGVEVGLAGGAISVAAEHRSIATGIVRSSLATAVLVALVLLAFFRSARLLAILVGTIAVATTVSFGAAALTVGHLNAATAFLGAIIAGNGVNYGILLVARYLEARRARESSDDALAIAIAGTLRPTAVASLGAAVAYGALATTSFKGFHDFAVIGAVGMLVCWVASYTLLPVLVVGFGSRARISSREPLVGVVLARLLGFKRAAVVCVCALGVGAAATAVVVRYIAADPFEYDITRLRSESADAVAIRRWMKLSDDTFGRGIVNRTYIASDCDDEVPKIVAALEAIDAGKPDAQRILGPVHSIRDLVPEHQHEKLQLLAEIRALLDDPALASRIPAELRRELRPPDELEPLTLASLPRTIRDRPEITDVNGRTGLVISIYAANRFDDWNGHDLIEFAQAVRRLELPGAKTVTTSGASVIFADILLAISHDGPIVTAVAAAAVAMLVLLVVGVNRRAAAVLAATLGGSLLTVAACALLGLKVNFLDFVALPITLGLGVDYAINVAHRHTFDPHAALRRSGAAVFVCSLTTMIGYGSLLASENLAIRGFGTASLIGEIACVLAALILVPAILAAAPQRGRTLVPEVSVA